MKCTRREPWEIEALLDRSEAALRPYLESRARLPALTGWEFKACPSCAKLFLAGHHCQAADLLPGKMPL